MKKDLNAAGDAIYSLKYAFVGQLADAFADNTTMTFAVDPNQKIKVDGVDKAMNTLVTVNNASEKNSFYSIDRQEERLQQVYQHDCKRC